MADELSRYPPYHLRTPEKGGADMAQKAEGTGLKKTLGLTGVTVNAMALIAPGAFLWITYQVQVGQTVPGGTATTALDMWPGLFFAFILAALTALSYSELARIFP